MEYMVGCVTVAKLNFSIVIHCCLCYSEQMHLSHPLFDQMCVYTVIGDTLMVEKWWGVGIVIHL